MSDLFSTFYPMIGVLITLAICFAAGDKVRASDEPIIPLICVLMAIAWPVFVAWCAVVASIEAIRARRKP